MPFFRQSASTPKQPRPGNKFFAIALLIGVSALAWLWVMEKPSRPDTTPVAKIAAKENKTIAPFSVLVMNKTNLVQTNSAPIFQSMAASNAPPVSTPIPVVVKNSFTARPVKNIAEAQIALARRGISAGSIDGAIGSQTRAALRAFQQAEKLPVTGELDALTQNKLLLTEPPLTDFLITTNELARLQPLGTNWLSKSQQDRLDYETILELVAEKTWCHPNYLKLLNPTVNWTNVVAPATVRVVNVEKPQPETGAAFVRIRLAEKTLQAFDAQTNLLAHFPCSIAQRVEKRPVGQLRVAVIAENPDYTFNPENFSDSIEARQINTKLILSPGPNNPVGTIWIGLDKPGYGIHGTPNPEAVGRTESLGCFRLANWNAEYLVKLVSVGMPIWVEP